MHDTNVACVVAAAAAAGGAVVSAIVVALCMCKRKKKVAPDVAYRPNPELELETQGLTQRVSAQTANTNSNTNNAFVTAVSVQVEPALATPGMVMQAEGLQSLPEVSGTNLTGHTAALSPQTTEPSVRELRERAAKIGIPAEAVEDARDGVNPRAALQELIRAAEQEQAEKAQARRQREEAAAREAAAAAARAQAEQEQAAAAAAAAPDQPQQMTMKELRERAAVLQVDGDAIEDARDSHDPRAALQELILAAEQEQAEKARRQREEAAAREAAAAVARAQAEQEQAAAAVADQLRGMTMKELRERAAVLRVDGDAIEDARDSHDPREALILLIQQRPIIQGP